MAGILEPYPILLSGSLLNVLGQVGISRPKTSNCLTLHHMESLVIFQIDALPGLAWLMNQVDHFERPPQFADPIRRQTVVEATREA